MQNSRRERTAAQGCAGRTSLDFVLQPGATGDVPIVRPAQHPGALGAELRSGRTNTWRKHCARPCPTAPPAPPGAPDPACLVVTTRPRISEQHCGLAKAWPMGGTNAHATCGQTAADKLLRRTILVRNIDNFYHMQVENFLIFFLKGKLKILEET